MKRQITSIILAVSVLVSVVVPVRAADKLPEKGKTVQGFEVSDVISDNETQTDIVTFTHKKTGAKVVYLANDDTNRAFSIAFRTPASDTGISHVFEHATLSASEKYPLDIFFPVSSRTATTFMNAFTFMNMTMYPISSISDKQLLKLSDYYLDAVFHPLILTNKEYFYTEAWRYEMQSPDDELTINGTVYSEMRGAMTPDRYATLNIMKTLFPFSHKAVESGGDPDIIPSLTYEEVQQYHTDYYIPSNSVSYIYGDVDYEEYLKLMDSYFSEFDDRKADTSDKNYTPINGHVEKEFKLPGGNTTVTGYAIPFLPETEEDIFGMSICAALLSDDSSYFSQTMREKFPDASIEIRMDMESTEPYILIQAYNLDKEDKDEFKRAVDDCINKTAQDGFDADSLDALAAYLERRTLFSGQEPSNNGITFMQYAAYYWMITDDPLAYFYDAAYSTDIKAHSENRGYEKLLEKYIINADRSVLVINIPDENLAKEKETALKEKLAKTKNSMSEEEINAIVKRSTEEKKTDTALESKLLKEINVSSTSEMKNILDDYKTMEYPYEDNTEDNVRYLSSSADIGDIGEGRIYIDISSLTDEQLLYLQLISDMTGELGTARHDQQETVKRLSRYIDGGSKFLPADDKMYYTFNFVTLNDDIDEMYDVLYEILFEQDFSDIDTLTSLVERYAIGYENGVESNPASFIINRVMAVGNEKQAVYNYLTGLDYYEFLNDVDEKLNENPEEVTAALNETVTALKNKCNAVTVFAGNDDGIEKNNTEAKKFWSQIPYEERNAAKRNIPVPDKSEGIIIDSALNYNAEAASLPEIGTDRDGKFTVTSEVVSDKLLIPQLRYVKGAYGVQYNINEYGTYICSYRDPQIKDTFDYYGSLSELTGNMDISQEELDGYIISSFVNRAKLRGDLEDKWHFLTTKVYTSEKELYTSLSEILDTTPSALNGFKSVYKNLTDKGVKSTIGKEGDIIANSDLFNKILIPFGSGEIYIYVDGKRVETDTAPLIKNDRTLVPIRVISESLGAKVDWNDETKTVTINGDNVIIMKIGDTGYEVNQAAMQMDTPPEIINERTMVPLRAVAEALGKDVQWKTGCVVIK